MNQPHSIKQGHPSHLSQQFQQPDGWQWGFIENSKKQHLRYGWTIPDNPKGFVVIAPGLSEFCEKYFEVIRDLKADGYAVAILEWRGHGLSWRYHEEEDRHKRSSDGFENDIEDFKLFLNELNNIRAKHNVNETPMALLAHSMGGNIALRYIHDNPDDFVSATLTAPMMGIKLPPGQRNVAGSLCAFFNRVGRGEWYAPGQGPWTTKKYDLTSATLTSDVDRRKVHRDWLEWNPELQAGGITYNWLGEALKSCQVVRDKYFLKTIKTPCFFAIAEDEDIVMNDDILHSVQHIPDVQIKEYEKARHEIMMERDDIRSSFLSDFKSFAFKMT
jgi:lysophospholipase